MKHHISHTQAASKWSFTASVPGDLIICYHNNCMDGILAGGMAFHALRGKLRDNAKSHLLPITYDNTMPFEASRHPNATVYFVDFCPTAEQIRELLQHDLRAIYVYDHHKTGLDHAKAMMQMFEDVHTNTDLQLHFDLEHSGAGLVAKSLGLLEGMRNSEYETLMVAERFDLWKHKGDLRSDENYLANCFSALRRKAAPAYSAAANTEDYDSRLFHLTSAAVDLHADMRPVSFSVLIEVGLLEAKDLETQARKALETAVVQQHGEDNGGRFILVKAPGSVVPSVVAEALERWPGLSFVVCWQQRVDGYKLSLRQGADESYDLTQVAKALDPNGGGHRNAAGAFVQMSLEELNAALLKIVEPWDQSRHN